MFKYSFFFFYLKLGCYEMIEDFIFFVFGNNIIYDISNSSSRLK